MMKVDPEIVRWHCRWARGIPGVYTVKPEHARLAVSQAVARSYVLASASSARRLASDYSDECDVCNDGGGVLLLCDASLCRRVAHLDCVGLTRVPAGTWFCPICATPPVSPSRAAQQAKKRG